MAIFSRFAIPRLPQNAEGYGRNIHRLKVAYFEVIISGPVWVIADKYIDIINDVTLSGTGSLVFQNPSSSSSYRDRVRIYDGVTLTNAAGHTIEGGHAYIRPNSGSAALVNNGEIRSNTGRNIEFETTGGPGTRAVTNNDLMIAENAGDLIFDGADVVNTGTITADSSGSYVTFESDTTLDNETGTLQALNDGELRVYSTIAEVADFGTFDASAGRVVFRGTISDTGTWLVDASYGDFSLENGANITGITFASTGGQLITLDGSCNFTDIAIDTSAIIDNQSGSHDLFGTFTNDGTFRFDTDNYIESLTINNDMVLAGQGTMLLQNPSSSASYRDRIYVNDTVTLTNGPDHTISGGYGWIRRSSGTAAFINQSEVRCDVDRYIVFDSYYGAATDFTVTNDGEIRFDNAGVVNNSLMHADGTGAYIRFLNASTLDNTNGTLRATNDGAIHLNSTVTVAEIADLGTLDAAGGSVTLSPTFNQPGQTWVIDANYGDLTFGSGTALTGITIQSPDSHLIQSTSTTDGMITVDGGLLQLVNSTLSGTANLSLSNNGQATLDATTEATFGGIDNDGVITLSGATLTTDSYTGTGELTVTSEMTVNDSMTIEANSDITVGNGDRVTVGGDYDLQMVFDINYDYGSSGELRMTGGTGAGPTEWDLFATHEVAGQDIDENDDPNQGSPAGFVDNFSLPNLIIGSAARIILVDQNDNGHRGGADLIGNESEALYVDTLTFEDTGGLLALNGYRIYFNSTNAQAGQIILGSDCNENGTGDNRDIVEGVSLDCNTDGTPDECEIDANSPAPGGPFFCTENCDPDCNVNGIPDECDIADCPPLDPNCDDCNNNQVPDACDIAGGTSFDFNTNGIPDECEPDCNNNGIPDECDLDCGDPNGPCDLPGCGESDDCNFNGIPDECAPGDATSTWIGPDAGLFADPNNWDPSGVPDGAVVIANDTAVDNTCVLDMAGTTTVCKLDIDATGAGTQTLQIGSAGKLSPTGGTTISGAGGIELAGGTLPGPTLDHAGNQVIGYGTVSAAIVNAGLIEGSASGNLTLSGDSFDNQAAGRLLAPASSTILLQSATVTQAGTIEIRSLASLVASAALTNSAAGQITLLGGTISAPSVTNAALADIDGFGTFDTDVTNDGDMTIVADAEIVGDLHNDGTVTVQNGTLTILGNLTGSGTIIGDFAGGKRGDHGLPRAAGDGFFVQNDYVAGAAASLLMPSADAVVRIGGDFDVAIDDNTHYDMMQAELRMVGLGAEQTLELMCQDVGPWGAGLNPTIPGHYPIDTLRIGPTPATVTLVDRHDNDGEGQAECEVLYVDTLQIDAGTTLNNALCPIYYNELIDNGTVTNPENLIQISYRLGDLNCDGVLNSLDIDPFVTALTSTPPDYTEYHNAYPGCDVMMADCNDDGSINSLDIDVFVSLLTG